jgi:hypothetical protein
VAQDGALRGSIRGGTLLAVTGRAWTRPRAGPTRPGRPVAAVVTNRIFPIPALVEGRRPPAPSVGKADGAVPALVHV